MEDEIREAFEQSDEETGSRAVDRATARGSRKPNERELGDFVYEQTVELRKQVLRLAREVDDLRKPWWKRRRQSRAP